MAHTACEIDAYQPWGYEVGAVSSTGEYMTLGWAGDVIVETLAYRWHSEL